MKMKSTIVALAMLAAVGATASSVMADASVTLNLVYIGSTAGNASAATRVAQNSGTGVLLNATTAPGGNLSTITSGLTQYTPQQLASDAVQSTVNLKNYFAVYLDYVPNLPTDSFYGIGFNVNMPAGMVPVSGNNLRDTTTNKLLAFNPVDDNTGVNTWEIFGDLGAAAGDLQGYVFAQATAANAYAMLIGQPGAVANGDNAGYITGKGTLLGVFALGFTGIGVSGDISVQATPGNVKWFYENSDTAQAGSDAAFHTAAFTIPGIPEPASIGVLALGGLALLARRRK